MKALITGGSGYFGSLLLNKLLEKGYECSVFDINDADDRPSEVEFFKADICDYDAINKACEGVDAVFHNVAQVPLAKDKSLFEAVNIGGTKNLLEACLSQKVGKVVYTSSSAVFGVPSELPVTEETPPSPAESYGAAKYKGEILCAEYQQKGLDISTIRPRTILGHGRLGIFQILFEWIRQGANVPVLGDGSNVYQFVHADDMAEVCIRAAERKGAAIYNCGAEKYGSMRSVLENLCEYAGTGSVVKSVPMKPAVLGMRITSALGLSPLGDYHWLMYGKSMYFDTSKVKNELNYTTKYSNEEMFIDSYDWYLKNRSKVSNSDSGGSSFHRSALKQGALQAVRWFL